jgi:formate dehydrogenase subunit beta
MQTIIPVDQGDVNGAIKHFLQGLMETGILESIYVPMEVEGGAVIPALVTDPKHLVQSNLLAPVMPINGARAVSALTGKRAPARLGAVLRSCEIRALIELVKLQQASLEGVVLIGVDCPGTYEVAEFINLNHNLEFDEKAFISSAFASHEPMMTGNLLRKACQMCIQPIPENVDIHMHIYGIEGSDLRAAGIPVTLKDEIGARLGLEASDFVLDQAQLEALLVSRGNTRSHELESMRNRLAADGSPAQLLSACIRCHNCMTVCPVCYCKTCLFKSSAFDHDADFYYQAAKRKGALRMMSDTLLFHMTRLNHMSTSCVSCGMCTSACPVDIPVGIIFSVISAQVQEAFGYIPGRDLNEKLPLISFATDEWLEIGEER